MLLGRNGAGMVATTLAEESDRPSRIPVDAGLREGGLPLRVLERDDTHLTQYFRALLEQLHQPLMGDPSAVAALLAQRYLPPALRQGLVIELSVQLVQAVIGLSSEMGSSDDPIAALDARAANWRYKLPLTLEDSVAKRLFSGLARHVQALTQKAQARLRWQVLRDAQTYALVRRLSLPLRLSTAQLPGNPPLRLHLWRGVGAQRVRVALLTRMTMDSYRCEVLATEALSVCGKAVVGAMHLELLGEGYAEALPVIGGEALEPLPWVFAPSGTEWVYQGEGALRVRAAQAQVLAPNGGVWQGTTTVLSEALDRTWYQLEGEATWTHPDWSQITVRCGRPEAYAETLELTGAGLDWALDAETVYRGAPHVVAIRPLA